MLALNVSIPCDSRGLVPRGDCYGSPATNSLPQSRAVREMGGEIVFLVEIWRLVRFIVLLGPERAYSMRSLVITTTIITF